MSDGPVIGHTQFTPGRTIRWNPLTPFPQGQLWPPNRSPIDEVMADIWRRQMLKTFLETPPRPDLREPNPGRRTVTLPEPPPEVN